MALITESPGTAQLRSTVTRSGNPAGRIFSHLVFRHEFEHNVGRGTDNLKCRSTPKTCFPDSRTFRYTGWFGNIFSRIIEIPDNPQK